MQLAQSVIFSGRSSSNLEATIRQTIVANQSLGSLIEGRWYMWRRKMFTAKCSAAGWKLRWKCKATIQSISAEIWCSLMNFMALGTEYEKFILSWHFKMSWFSLRHTPGGITILQVPNGITVVPAGIGPKRLGTQIYEQSGDTRGTTTLSSSESDMAKKGNICWNRVWNRAYEKRW